MKRFVYMDHAATTYTDRNAISEMYPYFAENYGNPSSIYDLGVKSKEAIENARIRTSKLINSKPERIFFTSGGTESDNWAIKGVAKRHGKGHIITSTIEHPAVINTCKELEKEGYQVSYIDVDEKGKIIIDKLIKAIRANTFLISVMYANNEIGTIQPIDEIGRIARERGILFHTDAVQAYGQMKIDVDQLNIDLLSASGHKIYGPKGVGLLYIRDGTEIDSIINGGGQEQKMRSGTENVTGIVGFGKAADIMRENFYLFEQKKIKMRDYMIRRILNEIPYSYLNGSEFNRLSGNVSITFKYIEGTSVLVLLDMAGICASAGSACSSGSKKGSHVLRAIGVSDKDASGALRFTLGHENTKQDVDYVIDTLKSIIFKLRNETTDYNDIQGKKICSKCHKIH